MLFAYILVAFVMAWWMGNELRTAARAVMGDTARLIGQEVSGALHEVSVDNLIKGDSRARKRLGDAVESTARASSVLSALSIIDNNGNVVASDDSSALGKTLARPDKVFETDREPQLFSTFAGPFDTGTHLLLTPIYKDWSLVGYIQMNLSNRVIGRLFEATYWRLLLFGLMGFVAIISVGIILHVRLSRFQYRIATMFDSALSGKRVEEVADENEFGQIQSAAQRLGRELHAARGRAEQSKQELDTVSSVLKVGMLLLGPTGKLEFSNSAAQEILTGGQPAVFAEQIASIQESLQTAVERLRTGGVPNINVEVELTIDAVRRRFRMELYAMDQQDWRRFLAIVKDRDMIDALENDLRAATRFRGLSTLYVGAAHDLRGPLNNMVVHLELLKQGVKAIDQGNDGGAALTRQRHHIDIIQQEIYRLNRYVQALLDLTAPTQDTRSVLDLVQALTEISGLVRAQAKLQRVELNWQLPDSPIFVLCQQVQLRQVLLNIIINALESMPSGGVVTASVRQEEQVIIDICDTGPGIPEALQQRIFDMHFTTKNTGTGIGLYVARSVVNEHGGTITLRSSLGEGTCFTISIPIADSTTQDLEQVLPTDV